MTKKSLKQILVDDGLAENISIAERMIMSGEVTIKGINRANLKAGMFFNDAVHIEIKKKREFVSRGGIKLKEAIEKFELDIRGKVCCDIGASTGGFTDCLLKYGAAKVYAIDTGYGKIDYKLREDHRVILFENTNFKFFDFNKFDGKIAFFAVDVSFISILRIVERLRLYCRINSAVRAILLIKPQFEALPNMLRKGILPADSFPAVLESTLNRIAAAGFYIIDECSSPIKGAKGNREHLILIKCG